MVVVVMMWWRCGSTSWSCVEMRDRVGAMFMVRESKLFWGLFLLLIKG